MTGAAGFSDRTGLKDEINDFAADKQQQDGRKMHWFREPLVEIIDQCGGASGEVPHPSMRG